VHKLPAPTPRIGRPPPAWYAAALAVFVAAWAVPPAGADVYKCAGEGGRPVYQEMPCPPGKELRNFQSDPPEITVLPGTPRAGGTAPPAPSSAASGNHAKQETTPSRKAERPRGDPGERKHLHTGMTEGEVLARIGPPDATTGGKSGKQQRWSWFPVDGDPETLTTVTLMSGYVTNVERTLVKR
jgi:hypothetical protein